MELKGVIMAPSVDCMHSCKINAQALSSDKNKRPCG
jgi:hypothetical protein